MRKKAAGILKAVWTIVISVALISAGLMCLSLQKQVEELSRLPKNAPVLILDEATAFADPDNETRVQAAFKELAKGRTVIMIAHRLSTVVNADRIFVLKDGHLTEDGTFAELSKGEQSLFGTMWRDYQQSVQRKVAKEA